MRPFIVLGALTIALATAGSAQAGGWASVGVAPLPTGIEPGETWRPEIKVLQHGVTPLGGLTPVLTIRNAATGEARQFTATPTRDVGLYEAEVVFPDAGEWNIVVDSGFGDSRLTFGPETIGAPPGTGALPDDFPLVPVGAAVLAFVLLAAATIGVRRRWGPTPASR